MPTPPSYLAFDLGASSSRAILGTLDDGKMRMTTLHRFKTPLITAGDHLYWDIEAIWNELLIGLDEALAATPRLRSLSVDSWGVDYVRLSSTGEPLALPYCYRDQRTDRVMDQVFARCIPAEIYQLTGIQFLAINTLYQVVADQEMHDSENTAMHLSIADYLNHRFSGVPVWEASMASTTQLKDLKESVWSAPLFEKIGLAKNQWPRIVPSGTLLGPAKDLPSVQIIATCSHDTGCAVAAAPAENDGTNWAYISCGTWSLLGVERTLPLATDAAREAGFTHEVGVDNTYRFLKNIVGLWVLQECLREWSLDTDWEALTEQARLAPSPGFNINMDDSRFVARGNMPGRIADYCTTLGHTAPRNQAGIVRLVLESLAQSYANNLMLLEEITGEKIAVVHLFGGGAQNTLLCQLTANATGLPIIAGPYEATALGNLLIQARTLGDLPANQTIRTVSRNSSDLVYYSPDDGSGISGDN